VAAGLSQSTGLTINAPPTWTQIVTQFGDIWVKLVVTIFAAVLITYALRVWRSPAALPAVMIAIPVVWFAVIGTVCMVSGTSWGAMQHWLFTHHWIAASEDASKSPSVLEVRFFVLLYVRGSACTSQFFRALAAVEGSIHHNFLHACRCTAFSICSRWRGQTLAGMHFSDKRQPVSRYALCVFLGLPSTSWRSRHSCHTRPMLTPR
jgi:hypothetical protein